MTTPLPTQTAADHTGSIRHHWPVLAGIGFAGVTAYDLTNGAELAPVLAASAVVYLGAAALEKKRAAWPVFFVSVVIITAAKLLGVQLESTWVIVAGGVALALVGLARGVIRPRHGLPLQSLALIIFGLGALAATLIRPDLGAYGVAAGLLGHAAWDVHHYRTKRVVVRSMAEFCLVLDTILALTIIIVTALG